MPRRNERHRRRAAGAASDHRGHPSGAVHRIGDQLRDVHRERSGRLGAVHLRVADAAPLPLGASYVTAPTPTSASVQIRFTLPTLLPATIGVTVTKSAATPWWSAPHRPLSAADDAPPSAAGGDHSGGAGRFHDLGMPETPGDVELDPHQLPIAAVAHEPVPVIATDGVVRLGILGIEDVVSAHVHRDPRAVVLEFDQRIRHHVLRRYEASEQWLQARDPVISRQRQRRQPGAKLEKSTSISSANNERYIAESRVSTPVAYRYTHSATASLSSALTDQPTGVRRIRGARATRC